MESIEINVSFENTSNWESNSPLLCNQLQKSIERQIDTLARKSKLIPFERLLDEINIEAETNGLTEEILNEDDEICNFNQNNI